MAESVLGDVVRNELVDLIAEARDRAPRLPDDADSWDVLDAITPVIERLLANERAKVTAAVLPLVEAVEDTYDDCTPSRGCTGCELRLYASRVRTALTTIQPQPTEVAGELWLLDGSGA